MLGGTAIVVSPLIALMQDQVAQLKQAGIPAAVLNSLQSRADQHTVMKHACEGAFRLIYLSPERLARPDTLGWLAGLPLSFFAIDEAHCISEWGHEFRPDYRQLGKLRDRFPDVAIAAFTASATRRVRHDILAQLKLRDPHKCIVSFHRPNLRYTVRQCGSGDQEILLMRALREHDGDSVIVYAPTIARVEEMALSLTVRGFPAVPYHGKMDAPERKRNQERWMSDEIRVLVGTIAFGLGINKAAVRCVVHLSLPKSVEQFYQEAGRAGRDGLPADCLLLWQPKDTGLLSYFINLVEDPAEQKRCWQRYHEITGFAESTFCRTLRICRHFGEQPKWTQCGHCDICCGMPEWLNTPDLDAATLSVDHARPSRKPQQGAANPALLDRMRQWRREMARETGMPAFIILNDSSLIDLCSKRPANRRELLRVAGIGERKAELFGDGLIEALQDAIEDLEP
jgi:ATP-dependent DNA helicase RecQ